MSDREQSPKMPAFSQEQLDAARVTYLRMAQELSPQERGEFAAVVDRQLRDHQRGLLAEAAADQLIRKALHTIPFRVREAYIENEVPYKLRLPFNLSKAPNQFAAKQVLAWWKDDTSLDDPDAEPSQFWVDSLDRGIIAFGDTRQGKTRSILALLIDQYRADGESRRFRFVRMVDFAREVRTRSLQSQQSLNEYLHDLYVCPVLILDDLHQAKLTARVAEELFALIDFRTTADAAPLFVTCQMVGSQLIKRIAAGNPDAEETARAIAGRIREHCHPVDFDFYPVRVPPSAARVRARTKQK